MQTEPSQSDLERSERAELRILCADDVLICRKLIQNVLERDGHLVIQATNGQEAFDMINGAPDVFDLLVTDHNMPVLDGLGLVRRLREIEFKGAIVVVSAGFTNEEAAIYRRLGVQAILSKPLAIAELRRVVQALLK